MATLVSIGIVSTRIGVHQQTLREYERQGLVVPARTPGGTRRYSAADMQRIERIQRLTAEGMSLAAVAYVLSLEDELARLKARLAHTEGTGTPAENEPAEAAPELPHGRPGAHAAIILSSSVALVHTPRPKRSPRWRREE